MKTGVCAAKGFLANGVHCGIRANQSKNDLAVIYSKEPCVAAAVYTTNESKTFSGWPCSSNCGE